MSDVLHPMSSILPQELAGPAPPTFRVARDLLLQLSDGYVAATTTFVWPRPERFNWALTGSTPSSRPATTGKTSR